MMGAKVAILIFSCGLLARATAASNVRVDRILHASRTVSKKFALTRGAKISLDTELGNVYVDTYSGDSVELEGVIIGKSEEDIRKFVIESHCSNNELNITGKGWENSSELGINIIIYVPQTIDLSELGIVVGMGNIRVSDIKCNSMVVKKNAGGAWISRVSSKIRIRSNAGDLFLTDVSGDVDGTLSTGDLFGRCLSGTLTANVGAGQVDVALTSSINKVRLITGAGEVHIWIPRELAANLNARTTAEAAESMLYHVFFGPAVLFPEISFQGTVQPHSIIGTINGGGATIKAESALGNVYFEIERR